MPRRSTNIGFCLILPTIYALADEDVLVVVTTGNKPVECLGALELPKNVRIEQFIPHSALLPFVDVMVTNGGFNGVQIALAHGIPLVAAGTSEDKPEVCARIAWSGVGINLKTKSPSPSEIQRAVKTLLNDEHYQQNAKRLQSEIHSYRPAGRAVDLCGKKKGILSSVKGLLGFLF
jgi:UDP:flavonoid glycosyltransferase YjiC (YdhE family)